MEKINLLQKFGMFSDHWQPKVIAKLNGQEVKVAKVKGEFVRHHHDAEDELFFVVKGTLTIKFRDHDVVLNEGEMLVIPHGIEHKPVAEGEAWLMLFEPASTVNTGNVSNERTVHTLENL